MSMNRKNETDMLAMKREAMLRMELLGVEENCRNLFEQGEIPKAFVDHEKLLVMAEDITEEEKELMNRIEDERDILIYYVIRDEGMWPDGCKFPRYSFLCVDTFESDYKMIREDCILRFETVPAYVYNCEEPECSELAEIPFECVGGRLVNLS